MAGSDSEATPSAPVRINAAPPRAPPPARTLRGLLPFVADVLLHAMTGALWAFHGSNAIAIAAGWVAGSVGSRVAAVAEEVTRLAYLAVGVLLPLAGPLLFWKIDRSFAKAREVGSGVTVRSEGEGERRRPASSTARPGQAGGRRGASLIDLISFICILVVVLKFELEVFAPAMGSWFATPFGSRITGIARFVGSLTMCFGYLPRWFLQVRALRG
ncbi:hypothetical protein QOZ80_8BG0659270 [Eleusine coracana subsp. coracana]|nr:hypothetical protein QOZ80_8BG0659270 [Eleusine coracana subsp. coracana]